MLRTAHAMGSDVDRRTLGLQRENTRALTQPCIQSRERAPIQPALLSTALRVPASAPADSDASSNRHGHVGARRALAVGVAPGDAVAAAAERACAVCTAPLVSPRHAIHPSRPNVSPLARSPHTAHFVPAPASSHSHPLAERRQAGGGGGPRDAARTGYIGGAGSVAWAAARPRAGGHTCFRVRGGGAARATTVRGARSGKCCAGLCRVSAARGQPGGVAIRCHAWCACASAPPLILTR